MERRTKTFFFVLLLWPIASAWSEQASPAEATRLLQKALGPSTVSYQGRMMVTHWYGKNTRAEEVRVNFLPPNHFRWEFLHPDGSTARVVVSDGKNEQVRFAQSNKVLRGGAIKSIPKRMHEESEWALLEKNYSLALTGSESVCGRDAWVLELSPLIQGKLSQRLWVDKEIGVVLENKRFRPHGDFVVLSRFTRFKPNVPLDKSTFDMRVKSGKPAEDHDFEPDFLSLEELKKDTGRTIRLPESLPDGFVFESADTFTVDGKPVDHVRYTDGLSILSIFETMSPVRFSARGGRNASTNLQPGSLQMHETGAVLRAESSGHHYTLVGDVSQDILQTISASLK